MMRTSVIINMQGAQVDFDNFEEPLQLFQIYGILPKLKQAVLKLSTNEFIDHRDLVGFF